MISIVFSILTGIVVLIACFFVFWKFCFLRDPDRKIPKRNFVLAPADGKIIKILDLKNVNNLKIDKGLVGKIKTTCKDVGTDCYMIAIFMNLLSVHIQRASYSGKVLSVIHKKGTLGITTSFKNGLTNEKTETLIQNKEIGKFKIIQIAGFIVKRIENWLKPGEKVSKGQRMGLINFGSQVCLIIPKKKIKLIAKEGDKVKAGLTPLARVK